jgi:hypothetical protein
MLSRKDTREANTRRRQERFVTGARYVRLRAHLQADASKKICDHTDANPTLQSIGARVQRTATARISQLARNFRVVSSSKACDDPAAQLSPSQQTRRALVIARN